MAWHAEVAERTTPPTRWTGIAPSAVGIWIVWFLLFPCVVHGELDRVTSTVLLFEFKISTINWYFWKLHSEIRFFMDFFLRNISVD
ncbi:hypothetical protein RvY_14528 [Ramazzottius varieornatus]|uniref:Uncharacterized protein n=1 Tax=Ramazzottius varieornatus TaxID=947166 RepID=A0A1D1VTK2_RAMVA|nr:hypothetical protein RvY_14528 [Ramazzottius varieornatus]